MKVSERDLIMGGFKCGATLYYEDVEPELQVTSETPKLTRVLPSQFFYEKRLYFYLINRYEPGEKKTFPQGGFEVRDESGAMRSYLLDQVIIHPAIIKHKKTLDKMARRAEKEAKKRERRIHKVEKENKPKHSRRGRPALDPAIKAAREAERAARNLRSGNKRGRPKSLEPKIVTENPNTSSGKKYRGRPALSPEVKAAREQLKVAARIRSGGKRGRPKSRS